MNIEEAIERLKLYSENAGLCLNGGTTCIVNISDLNWLLTAYEKEKEKNKKIDEFCRKELAFERRLQRENRQPDEFNQGRFYVSENIRKIIKEE